MKRVMAPFGESQSRNKRVWMRACQQERDYSVWREQGSPKTFDWVAFTAVQQEQLLSSGVDFGERGTKLFAFLIEMQSVNSRASLDPKDGCLPLLSVCFSKAVLSLFLSANLRLQVMRGEPLGQKRALCQPQARICAHSHTQAHACSCSPFPAQYTLLP